MLVSYYDLMKHYGNCWTIVQFENFGIIHINLSNPEKDFCWKIVFSDLYQAGIRTKPPTTYTLIRPNPLLLNIIKIEFLCVQQGSELSKWHTAQREVEYTTEEFKYSGLVLFF